MNHHLALMLLLSLILLSSPLAAQAQTLEAASRVTVEGQITNATTGEPAPAGLSLMAHTYDDGAMTNMIDGTSDQQGRFHFENVPAPAGRTFEMMVVYQDVAYFSEEIKPEPDQIKLKLPVFVYETTTGAEDVRVDQQHVLLAPSPGTLQVTQVFVLSNQGDHTVRGNGESGLHFRLPAGATDVAFEGTQDPERYRRTEDGFVDTGAVRPGQRTQAAVVSYSLPYEGQLELQVPVDYPTAQTTAFLPDGSVLLDGMQWEAGEEMLIRDQVHQAYSYTGGSLALIGSGGIWWWRDQRGRTEPVSAETASEPMTLETTLQAIAALDDAYEHGTVAETQYEERRAHLRDRAVKLMMAQEDG